MLLELTKINTNQKQFCSVESMFVNNSASELTKWTGVPFVNSHTNTNTFIIQHTHIHFDIKAYPIHTHAFIMQCVLNERGRVRGNVERTLLYIVVDPRSSENCPDFHRVNHYQSHLSAHLARIIHSHFITMKLFLTFATLLSMGFLSSSTADIYVPVFPFLYAFHGHAPCVSIPCVP